MCGDLVSNPGLIQLDPAELIKCEVMSSSQFNNGTIIELPPNEPHIAFSEPNEQFIDAIHDGFKMQIKIEKSPHVFEAN